MLAVGGAKKRRKICELVNVEFTVQRVKSMEHGTKKWVSSCKHESWIRQRKNQFLTWSLKAVPRCCEWKTSLLKSWSTFCCSKLLKDRKVEKCERSKAVKLGQNSLYSWYLMSLIKAFHKSSFGSLMVFLSLNRMWEFVVFIPSYPHDTNLSLLGEREEWNR